MASKVAKVWKIAYNGLISTGMNRKTVLYSSEGPLESNYSKETAKEQHKFLTQNHE